MEHCDHTYPNMTDEQRLGNSANQGIKVMYGVHYLELYITYHSRAAELQILDGASWSREHRQHHSHYLQATSNKTVPRTTAIRNEL